MLIVTFVALLEMGGFACRIRMLLHPTRSVYIMMHCLLIIPPSFLALVRCLAPALRGCVHSFQLMVYA